MLLSLFAHYALFVEFGSTPGHRITPPKQDVNQDGMRRRLC